MGEVMRPVLDRILTRAIKSDEEIQSEEARLEQARFDRTIVEFAESAGGKRIAASRFGNYEAKTASQKEVLATVQEWANTFPERSTSAEGLVLYGPCGTGKDHLVFSAVRQVMIQHRKSAHWRNGRDLMGLIRDRITEEKSEQDFIRYLTHSDILVISDPLPTMGELKEFQADMLYRIIENRYADAKITVMTLNVSDDSEADRRLGAATWDRVCDRAWKCFCNWPSHRKPARIVGARK